MPRKVLVTGGAGFIGSQVGAAYIAKGDRVWIVDDLSTGREANLPQAAEFVKTSIGSPQIAELFKKVGGFDLVSHHAAQVDVRKSVADPRHDASINIDGFLNVLTQAAQHGTKRFLFVSSGGVVYGEPELRPTPETSAKLPLSPYGVSKLTAEFYLHYFHCVHGLEYVALRYANVYGPRQDPHGEAGVVAIFCSSVSNGRGLTIFGDGEQTRDYVFVGDVVAANLLLSDTRLARATELDSRAFNVGTSVPTSVNQLAEAVMRVAGRKVDCKRVPERRGELRHSCLSGDKLRALGWQPKHSLEQGLAQTYEYITKKEHGE